MKQYRQAHFALALLAVASLFPAALFAAPPTPGAPPSPGATVPGSNPAPGLSALPVTPAPIPPAGVTPSAGPNTPSAGPNTPKPSSTPAGALVKFSGQLLDVRGGFVFFTSGDGFRLAPGYQTLDYKTNQTTTRVPDTGLYAVASFDPVTGTVVRLAISSAPVPAEASYENVAQYAVMASKPVVNPELAPGKEALSGRPVPVTFTVLVPPTTKLTDAVYIETDKSNWDPQAIKLGRIDILHFRVILRLNSGTHFLYRFTRGSATTVERSRNGQEQPPRNLFVRELDVYNQDDTVYNWADDPVNGGTSILPGPDNVPTPFSANPFPYPTPRIPGGPSPPPVGPPPPYPTPH